MTKAIIIFGGDAIRYYNETGQIPSAEWLMDNGGAVQNIEFPTKAEYNAYVQGVSDATCGAIIIFSRKLPKRPNQKVRFGCDWA